MIHEVNGSITAIVGKKSVMKYAQQSFISSTFWTERIGPVAALATLKEMKRIKSWKIIDNNGKFIIENWKKLAKKHNLSIEISGLPATCSFTIKSKNFQKYKTLITQEMLKRGFLATNVIYSSTSHSKKILKKYLFELDKIFNLIKKCEEGLNINKLLKYPVSHDGFKRLN